ncbi:MAG: hypothetical protein A2015_06015 [Spirochaetes bacterium GWF1_31_7]|nr:MAG: hypothetical protein A2Y30_07695 [Spirochaetes bacterium GWE1_32_154]OHD50812.1 MAG: hypothetical protein A2Y29_02645 [Spirochaetes bacterium GWE2_31_10]OHD52749.1 MAG: hypothetical protein A2015_06015 [Spirochaetes bacterium GWF1_31_7]OHD82201.1 MAG: hypothetical protein A2355_18415 [Spirochaetes bacterium RIFOXYB1_FULL_32_8]HBD95425.1 hypothetical protein [Spirochaetia bacterium]
MATKFDDEELYIISSFNSGNLIQSDNDIKDIEMVVQTAKNTLNKSKHIEPLAKILFFSRIFA